MAKTEVKKIGQAELLKLVMSGQPVLVGDYLSGRVDTINIRVKVGPDAGKMRKGYVRRETIITDTEAVAVGGFLPDGEDDTSFSPSAKRGDKVVVKVSKVESVSGFKLYDGEMFLLVP